MAGCQFEPLEQETLEPEIQSQDTGPYQIEQAKKSDLQVLGQKMNKRLGVDPIQSAQFREMSDFIFDLESALITIDTTRRKTYTVPFLEKEDRYSTFNLVVVTDSLDNLLDQYILQYGFDSLQYSSFLASGDFLQSGAEIKRFSFSSFFNDSNPLSLERCQGISDENGDPIVCDEVTIDAGSSGGGGTSGGGTAWIPSGGGGGGAGLTCSWLVYIIPCNCHPHHTTQACGCQDGKPRIAMQITCKSPNMRNSYPSQSQMTCMDCDISDFGTPAFTPTKVSTAINRDLGGILSDYHLWYLSDNPSFANELRSALADGSAIDTDAALFTIAAGMNGALTGDFNSSFGLAIEGLMTQSSADFSNDLVLRMFQIYFEVKYAALKQANPTWSPEKLFYETAKDALHLSLDLAGLAPVLGEGADLLNAGLYFIEGDRLNGTLSLTAAIPFVGWYSTAAKGAVKFIGFLPGTTKRMSHVWGKVGNNVIFGGTSLRNVLQLKDASKHAHHIIPLEHVNHPVVQKAAKAEFPFHINEFSNGIAVDAWQNTTHPNYNDKIFDILEQFNNDYPNATPEQAKAFLEGEMERLYRLIQRNPSIKIDRLNF